MTWIKVSSRGGRSIGLIHSAPISWAPTMCQGTVLDRGRKVEQRRQYPCPPRAYILMGSFLQTYKYMFLGNNIFARFKKKKKNKVYGKVTLETMLAVSYKAKYVFTIWPTHPTPGILPKRNENLYSHHKTCMWMFRVAGFVIAPNWKQPWHPSTDEWINRL